METAMTELVVDPQHQPPRLGPGQLIGARYRLDRIAGAGGMATVWRAYDERLQRPVAIKVLSDALAANPTAVTRFAREARTHAGIQHPNLVQVYDYSVAAAQPYLVMEYVDGATLSERLDRGGLTAATIQTLALELLSAIACVHDHGVLHRDIKSANVLLDHDGQARLTDFGLARLEDSSRITRPNEVVGTLRFLAPELIDGHPASRQSDLFALGVVLRTAATQADLEPPLSTLIEWLTQRDPQARPADAHAALELLTERPAQVRPPRRTSAAGQQPKRQALRPETQRALSVAQLRNRVIAISALLVAFLGTAFMVATAGGAGKPNPPAAPLAARSHKATETAYAKGAPTIEQQLARLAAGVRRAAAP
jgi:serine/threonine-protein kinase